jgi:hypothetical protein
MARRKGPFMKPRVKKRHRKEEGTHAVPYDNTERSRGTVAPQCESGSQTPEPNFFVELF